MQKKNRYTFGSGKTAADRLEKIADFFNPPAENFIRRFLPVPCKTALDLGCGPGYTTDMLARATNAGLVYGMDTSGDFLKTATSLFPEYSFISHDVTDVPFPVQADVMYARFLLSHLIDPVSMINLWTSQLSPGGILFIDELEDIYTDIDVFTTYLAINRGLIASQDAVLYVGEMLAAGLYNGKVLSNESALLPVENRRAAEWFYPNTVTIWEKESYVLEALSAENRKKISEELRQIISVKDDVSRITWKMRRIAISAPDA